MDRVDDRAGEFQFDSRTNAVAATTPARVDQPDVDLVFLDLFGE